MPGGNLRSNDRNIHDLTQNGHVSNENRTTIAIPSKSERQSPPSLNGEKERRRRDRVTAELRLGRVDSRVPDQHPLPAQPRAPVARPHARLQVVAPRLPGPVPPLLLRSRDSLRLGARVAPLVDPRLRAQGRFHAPIRRRLERRLRHPDSHQALLESSPLFRRRKV